MIKTYHYHSYTMLSNNAKHNDYYAISDNANSYHTVIRYSVSYSVKLNSYNTVYNAYNKTVYYNTNANNNVSLHYNNNYNFYRVIATISIRYNAYSINAISSYYTNVYSNNNTVYAKLYAFCVKLSYTVYYNYSVSYKHYNAIHNSLRNISYNAIECVISNFNANSYSYNAISLKNAYNVSYNSKNTIISNSVSYTIFNNIFTYSVSYSIFNAYINTNNSVSYNAYSYSLYCSYKLNATNTSSFTITIIRPSSFFIFWTRWQDLHVVCLGNANLPNKDRGVSLWTDVSVYRSSSALLSTFYQQPFNNSLRIK